MNARLARLLVLFVLALTTFSLAAGGDLYQTHPILGTSPGTDDVLAVWTENGGEGAAVYAVAVDWEGVRGEPVRVAAGSLVARDTAWSGDHYLVVHRDGDRLLATRVERDGTPYDATPIELAGLAGAPDAEAVVVWAALQPRSQSRWVVAWTDGRALYSLTISPDGVPSSARTLDVHPPLQQPWLRFVARPRLAFDGSRLLLVWAEAQRHPDAPSTGPLPMKAWATRLTVAGAPSDPQPLDLQFDGAPSLSAASGGSGDFIVAGGQHVKFVGGNELLRVTAERELFGWPAVSDVVWNGAHYVVALRYFGASWYLALVPVEDGGNIPGTPHAGPTLPPAGEAAPSVGGRGSGNALAGVEETSLTGGVRVTVYHQLDLPFMPDPPAPPRNVHVRPSSTGFEVTWDAPADETPDAYVVEQLLLGAWTVVARVTGDVWSASLGAGQGIPTLRVRAFNAAGPSEPAEPRSAPPKRRAVR